MTAQPTLWDTRPYLAARVTDPATSVAAAQAITPGRLERVILDVFERRTTRRVGFTDDELCGSIPRHHGPSVKSARSRLTTLGLLVDSGKRRDSLRGRPMIVWRLA